MQHRCLVLILAWAFGQLLLRVDCCRSLETPEKALSQGDRVAVKLEYQANHQVAHQTVQMNMADSIFVLKASAAKIWGLPLYLVTLNPEGDAAEPWLENDFTLQDMLGEARPAKPPVLIVGLMDYRVSAKAWVAQDLHLAAPQVADNDDQLESIVSFAMEVYYTIVYQDVDHATAMFKDRFGTEVLGSTPTLPELLRQYVLYACRATANDGTMFDEFHKELLHKLAVLTPFLAFNPAVSDLKDGGTLAVTDPARLRKARGQQELQLTLNVPASKRPAVAAALVGGKEEFGPFHVELATLHMLPGNNAQRDNLVLYYAGRSGSRLYKDAMKQVKAAVTKFQGPWDLPGPAFSVEAHLDGARVDGVYLVPELLSNSPLRNDSATDPWQSRLAAMFVHAYMGYEGVPDERISEAEQMSRAEALSAARKAERKKRRQAGDAPCLCFSALGKLVSTWGTSGSNGTSVQKVSFEKYREYNNSYGIASDPNAKGVYLDFESFFLALQGELILRGTKSNGLYAHHWAQKQAKVAKQPLDSDADQASKVKTTDKALKQAKSVIFSAEEPTVHEFKVNPEEY